MRYNREKAVEYAEKWALSRNPMYYNYDLIGGDCTNFVSQCLYAGLPQMNYEQYGWYYIDANIKSPSWTGVGYLFEFLIYNKSQGPRGREISKADLDIGDIIQLSFAENVYGHSLIVTNINNGKIFICAHSVDSKNRDIDTYSYNKMRFLKIF